MLQSLEPESTTVLSDQKTTFADTDTNSLADKIIPEAIYATTNTIQTSKVQLDQQVEVSAIQVQTETAGSKQLIELAIKLEIANNFLREANTTVEAAMHTISDLEALLAQKEEQLNQAMFSIDVHKS